LGVVVVPASLSAMVAVTLPGIGGLLIVCAAGVRLGYRQAKPGRALQATAMARFAGSGVLGVARCGSPVLKIRPIWVRGALGHTSVCWAFPVGDWRRRPGCRCCATIRSETDAAKGKDVRGTGRPWRFVRSVSRRCHSGVTTRA
jgi:hypothetical protein